MERNFLMIIALSCVVPCFAFNLGTLFIEDFGCVHNSRRCYIQTGRSNVYRRSVDSFPLAASSLSSSSECVRDVTRHLQVLDKSLERLTGRGLCQRMGVDGSMIKSTTNNRAIMEKSVWSDIHLNERFVVISHGTESDPIYNYGNAACLQAFARNWEDLCRLPSADSVVRLSVDEELRTELMSKVTRDGFVEGATGIRVTGDGRYLRLVDAVVWNCHDENGSYYGQAAFFDREKCKYVNLD